jgi:hypothetical protein
MTALPKNACSTPRTGCAARLQQNTCDVRAMCAQRIANFDVQPRARLPHRRTVGVGDNSSFNKKSE